MVKTCEKRPPCPAPTPEVPTPPVPPDLSQIISRLNYIASLLESELAVKNDILEAIRSLTPEPKARACVSRHLKPTRLEAGGTATIWRPSPEKRIRLKRLSVSVDAATRIEFRWGSEPFESFFLPENGSIVMNLVGCNEVGPFDMPLVVYSASAATVTAKAAGEEE